MIRYILLWAVLAFMAYNAWGLTNRPKSTKSRLLRTPSGYLIEITYENDSVAVFTIETSGEEWKIDKEVPIVKK